MATSADLDTAAEGSKIVRTVDGVFLATPGAATVELAAGDPAELLPVGSVVRVTATDSLVLEASIPVIGPINSEAKSAFPVVTAARVVTTDLTTIDDLLDGLETWRTSFATPAE